MPTLKFLVLVELDAETRLVNPVMLRTIILRASQSAAEMSTEGKVPLVTLSEVECCLESPPVASAVAKLKQLVGLK